VEDTVSNLRMIWQLTKMEFRWHAVKYLFVIPMALYFGWICGVITGNLYFGDVGNKAMYDLFVDVIFSIGVGVLGIAYMRESMSRLLCTRVPSKRLRFLRQLPIETGIIVKSRQLTAILNILMVYAVFFLFMYAITPKLHQLMSLPEYIAFALSWSGYVLLINSLYLFWETAYRAKIYMTLTIVVVIVLLGWPVLAWAFDFHVVGSMIDAVKQSGFVLPISSVAIGSVMMWVMGRKSRERLQKRDFEG
jgi:hypothetical protein